MQSQNIAPVYLTVDEKWDVVPKKIDVNSVFGHAYDSEDIYFAFEYTYGQNQQFVKGTLWSAYAYLGHFFAKLRQVLSLKFHRCQIS